MSTDKVSSDQAKISRIQDEFHRLRKELIESTWYYSSTYHASRHPSSRALVKLGWSVVPFMICDQYSTATHWFIQLNEITGENPVKEHHRGRIVLMAQDWLDWFVVRGRVSDRSGTPQRSEEYSEERGPEGETPKPTHP